MRGSTHLIYRTATWPATRLLLTSQLHSCTTASETVKEFAWKLNGASHNASLQREPMASRLTPTTLAIRVHSRRRRCAALLYARSHTTAHCTPSRAGTAHTRPKASSTRFIPTPRPGHIMASTLAVMTLTAVMTLPAFDTTTPKVSILSIGKGTIESARELVTKAEEQTAEFQSVATTKATFMFMNYCSISKPCTVSSCPRTRQVLHALVRRRHRPHTAWPLTCAHSSRERHYYVVHPHAPYLMCVMHHTMQATKCTLANSAGVRLEFIEAGSTGLLPSYKPPLILEPGEVASFLVDKSQPFQLKYNIETFQGPFRGWLDGDINKAVTVTSSTIDREINTVVQVDSGTTSYTSQIRFDVSTEGDFFNIVVKQLIDTTPQTVLELSSFVSTDENSPTYLGAGSDARSLTVFSAALGGNWIRNGQPFVAEEIQSQTASGASTASALWTLCIRDGLFLKAVQLRVTSSGGNLYAIAVQAGYTGSADADCGTWPLESISPVAGGFTANGYGVASLGYLIAA